MDGMMPANTDTVMDGADFLDRDSDNDCAPDSDAREMGAARTDPAMPSMSASANCAGELPVCDTMTGACVARPAPDAGPMSTDASVDAGPMLADAAMDSGAVSMDASVRPDAGAPSVSGDGTCGCTVPARSRNTPSALALLAVGAALVARRQRARR
jgi:MYXO-CTERM domain-containing protein